MAISNLRVMLACAAPALEQISFPKWVSPKLDGIRCKIKDGVAYARSGKPIPNEYVQKCLSKRALEGLDGELIIGDPTDPKCYNKTTSAILSRHGEPDFMFHVFDMDVEGMAYSDRMRLAAKAVDKYTARCVMVQHDLVDNTDALAQMEEHYVAEGYEGVMLNDPLGAYKDGRSTVKQQTLMKLKRFMDSEARILDAEPLRVSIGNERTSTGKRSSKAENKQALDMLGAFIVKDLVTGVEFSVGSGFTERQRSQLWQSWQHYKPELLKLIMKYKFQPAGMKDKPRFPTFQGWRYPEDMS